MNTTGVKRKDLTGAKLGMWLFLAGELFLFAGPFLLYCVYRYRFADGFVKASARLNLALGALNTAVLITSSLTMALAVSFVRGERRKPAILLLSATILLGAFFLFNKYMEWSGELGHGLYPGSAALAGDKGEGIFFGLYYLMTGIHGLHLFGGIIALGAILVMEARGIMKSGDPAKTGNTALYWHFVDIIWICLFPLFYLVR